MKVKILAVEMKRREECCLVVLFVYIEEVTLFFIYIILFSVYQFIVIYYYCFKMNEVDFLLERKFSVLSQVDKKLVKSLGPHQPKDIVIKQSKGKYNRTFNTSLFETVDWLTVSRARQSLFCFHMFLIKKKVLPICHV